MKVLLIVLGSLLVVMSLLLTIVNPLALIGVAFGVVLIIYGKKYKKPAPVVEEPKRRVLCQDYRIEEVEYNVENLLEIAEENSDYDMSKKEIIDEGKEDETIYRYEFFPHKVELAEADGGITEITVDGQFIGFLSEERTKKMNEFKATHEIKEISVDIWGGPYKYYDSEKEELAKREKPYGGKLLLFWYAS